MTKPFESDTVENGYVIYHNGILLEHYEVKHLLNNHAELSIAAIEYVKYIKSILRQHYDRIDDT